jgi:hypothetical protein
MSWEYESKLDPHNAQSRRPPAASLQWTLIGYLLGLLAMSPAPVLYYWLFAPGCALLVAGLCALAGTLHRRFRDMALGALVAAVFGAVTALVFFLGLANQ